MSTLESNINPKSSNEGVWFPPTANAVDETASRDSDLKFDLACELYELLEELLRASGLSQEAQKLASEGHHKVIKGQRDRPTDRVLREIRTTATILATWKNDKRFQENGDPAILPIAGVGRTLETLVRALKITMNMDQIVQKLCEYGDVIRIKGDRVGLLGTSAAIHRNNPTQTLAVITTHLRRMMHTALLNTDLPRERRAEGLFQRNVAGVIPPSKFPAFAQGIRPRLQEICDELEGSIGAEGSLVVESETENVCGFEIFLFREGYNGGFD